ncbi:hypothetical protein [Streptomyces sp. NPDC005336]|uniref:hypothetical protein n=1 Tax=unclassified Streptomyces TaxID=2593676 RepID=UPI0033A0A0AF
MRHADSGPVGRRSRRRARRPARSWTRRAAKLAASLAELDADLAGARERGLPRVTTLEDEYLRAVTAAEPAWIRSVIEDLRAGRLVWSLETLAAFAEGASSPASGPS